MLDSHVATKLLELHWELLSCDCNCRASSTIPASANMPMDFAEEMIRG